MLRSCRYCRRFTNKSKRCRFYKKIIDNVFVASSCENYNEHDPHAKKSIQNYYRNGSSKSSKLKKSCLKCRYYGENSKTCLKTMKKIKKKASSYVCRDYIALSKKQYNKRKNYLKRRVRVYNWNFK